VCLISFQIVRDYIDKSYIRDEHGNNEHERLTSGVINGEGDRQGRCAFVVIVIIIIFNLGVF